MLDINEKFYSIDEWHRWASANAFVYMRSRAEVIKDNIIGNGFVEPLTMRAVAPDQILYPEGLREGLVGNGLNARQRAVLSVLAACVGDDRSVSIFAAEAVTSFASLMRWLFPRFLGSEYAIDDDKRQAMYPIQHQDLMALDLPSDKFDFASTNEVLEHVPNLDRALSEICRVLKRGGWHIGTHPFGFMSETGQVRSVIENGQIVHLMPPEYHGNPVDPDGGSLVFETPGWDILARARQAGFSECHMRFVASERAGILSENTGIFVLCAQK